MATPSSSGSKSGGTPPRDDRPQMTSGNRVAWLLEHHPALEAISECDDNGDEGDGDAAVVVDQVFTGYSAFNDRLCRNLYFGGDSTMSERRFTKPVTEICVDFFNQDVGDLEGRLAARLDRLSMARAAKLSHESCASPTSLILALLYLERLRTSNPSYLASVSSADLFLVSLMVASKFLYDDDEEDEYLNDDWAKTGGLEKRELNRLEIDFLTAIDWKVSATPAEFEKATTWLETLAARRETAGRRRKWLTYSEALVFCRNMNADLLWEWLVNCTIKVTAVCVAAYAASLMTMVGTCVSLNRANLGPQLASGSVSTLLRVVLDLHHHNRTEADDASSKAALLGNGRPILEDQQTPLSGDDDADTRITTTTTTNSTTFNFLDLLLWQNQDLQPLSSHPAAFWGLPANAQQVNPFSIRRCEAPDKGTCSVVTLLDRDGRGELCSSTRTRSWGAERGAGPFSADRKLMGVVPFAAPPVC